MRWKAEIMGLLKGVEQVAIGGQLRRQESQDNTTIRGARWQIKIHRTHHLSENTG